MTRSARGPLTGIARIRSTRTLLAAAVAAPWILWALVRVAGLDRRYPVIAVMAFTPWAALTSVLPIVVALALRRWVVAGVAALVTLSLAGVVLPRALGGPRPPAGGDGRPFVVMTANLHHGLADPGTVVRLVRENDVDVLSLQELTADEVGRLDAAGLGRRLPHRVLDLGSGSGVLSRGPVVRTDSPTALLGARPEVQTRLPGVGPLRIGAVHPRPPITRRWTPGWQATLRTLPGPAAGEVPRILAGDFNATLDHRELRGVLDRGYVDAADAVGAGLEPSWPVGGRWKPGITIDHVLVPRAFGVRGISLHEVPGSDHRALIAELTAPAVGR